jgi:hypothetical protein
LVIKEINTIEKLTKGRKKKAQINEIRGEKGNITTDTSESQRIIRDYFENLYSSRPENQE